MLWTQLEIPSEYAKLTMHYPHAALVDANKTVRTLPFSTERSQQGQHATKQTSRPRGGIDELILFAGYRSPLLVQGTAVETRNK